MADSQPHSNEQPRTLPLSQVSEGKTVRLVSIEAGQGLRSRLSAMGISSHTLMKVINNSHPGPFVVNVRGCKIMLGRGMAHKIIVSPQSE